MQVQKVYNGRGSQGRKHALRRSRAEAKGSGVQTEGEERFFAEQGRKESRWTKQLSPPHLIHCNHLVGCINEEMTLNNVPLAHTLV